MKFVKCTTTLNQDVYINIDTVAEIGVTDEGCSIVFVTPDGDGDGARRIVKESIEQIFAQLPEGST